MDVHFLEHLPNANISIYLSELFLLRIHTNHSRLVLISHFNINILDYFGLLYISMWLLSPSSAPTLICLSLVFLWVCVTTLGHLTISIWEVTFHKSPIVAPLPENAIPKREKKEKWKKSVITISKDPYHEGTTNQSKPIKDTLIYETLCIFQTLATQGSNI